MMDLNTFKNWALEQGSVGKYPDSIPKGDDDYRGECVSLINQYCWRVLGVPAMAWGHAKMWAVNPAPLQYFSIVSELQPGDVLVYPNLAAQYGHIEIYLGGNQSLQQNRNLDGRVHVSRLLPGYIILRPKSKKGNDMSTVGEVEFNNLFISMFGPMDRNQPTQGDRKRWVGGETNTVIRSMQADPRHDAWLRYIGDIEKALQKADSGQYEAIQQTVYVKKEK